MLMFENCTSHTLGGEFIVLDDIANTVKILGSPTAEMISGQMLTIDSSNALPVPK